MWVNTTATHRNYAAAIIVAVAALMVSPPGLAEEAPITAWEKLLAENPEAAEDTSISVLERRILQVLSPEQAEAFADGQPPDSLVLANGETLEDFLDRRKRLDASGLLFKPLVPCRIFDTRRIGNEISEGNVVYLNVRGPGTDYSRQGGNAEGCGVPDLRGEVLLTNTARALMLSVEIDDATGAGNLDIQPAGNARRAGVGLLTYDRGPGRRQSLVVAMCDGESTSPCPMGDLALAVDGAAAHVVVDVVGYFEPPWSLIATDSMQAGRPSAASEVEVVRSSEKAATAPYWEPGVDPANIHYSDGNIGIGTASPVADVHVMETDSRANIYVERTDGHFVGLYSGTAFSGLGFEDTSFFSIGPIANINGSATKALTITPEKYVGIGTFTPDAPLTVYGLAHLRSNNPTLRLTDNSVAEGELGAYWNVRNQNSAFKIYEATRANSPAFFIRSDGNVGIHTTLPEEALQVDGNLKITGNILSAGDICIGNCN